MSDYEGMGTRQAIQALTIKITNTQRELALLRQDVR
jgi:hypothetical protein